MSSPTSVVERPSTTEGSFVLEPAPSVLPARPVPVRARWSWTPVVGMIAGVAALAAAVVLPRAIAGDHQLSVPAVPAVAAPAAGDPLAITLSARDVSVVVQVYEPGQDSGWHTHPGIHAVAVLSGSLTIYDSHCQPQTVEAGRPYVGGQELHLARNETATPVDMVVTYLNPSAPTNSSQHVAGPAGCTVG